MISTTGAAVAATATEPLHDDNVQVVEENVTLPFPRLSATPAEGGYLVFERYPPATLAAQVICERARKDQHIDGQRDSRTYLVPVK